MLQNINYGTVYFNKIILLFYCLFKIYNFQSSIIIDILYRILYIFKSLLNRTRTKDHFYSKNMHEIDQILIILIFL
jgi:hypothetical protein